MRRSTFVPFSADEALNALAGRAALLSLDEIAAEDDQ